MDYWLKLFADESNGYKLTSGQNSLIVSILSAGTFLGALTASPVADILGRRMGLMASTAIVFNFGVILQVAATSRPLFIAGRFFAGFGVGLISVMSEYFPF
jgi:SP family sugar:H+ symporter-like MFS transporter